MRRRIPLSPRESTPTWEGGNDRMFIHLSTNRGRSAGWCAQANHRSACLPWLNACSDCPPLVGPLCRLRTIYRNGIGTGEQGSCAPPKAPPRSTPRYVQSTSSSKEEAGDGCAGYGQRQLLKTTVRLGRRRVTGGRHSYSPTRPELPAALPRRGTLRISKS